MILRSVRLEAGAGDVGTGDARSGRVPLPTAVHRAARLPERDADGWRPRVERVGDALRGCRSGPSARGTPPTPRRHRPRVHGPEGPPAIHGEGAGENVQIVASRR